MIKSAVLVSCLLLLGLLTKHIVRALSVDDTTTTMSSSHAARKPVIIFCHGSGDTGAGAQAWVQSLIAPTTYNAWQWIFPTAEPIPYSLNFGMRTSVWYDRQGGFAPTFPEVTETVEKSTTRLLELIATTLKDHPDLSSRDVVMGGFSMGGNIALQTAIRWHQQHPTQPLGAVFGLSCYVNDDSSAWRLLQAYQSASSDHVSCWPPTFGSHGADDDFISPAWGQATHQRLVQIILGNHHHQAATDNMQFRLLPGVQHEMVADEMAELMAFLNQHVLSRSSDHTNAACTMDAALCSSPDTTNIK